MKKDKKRLINGGPWDKTSEVDVSMFWCLGMTRERLIQIKFMLCVVQSPSVHLSCFVYMSRCSITTNESYPHQLKCDHLLLACLRLYLKLIRFPAFPGQALRGQLNSLCV